MTDEQEKKLDKVLDQLSKEVQKIILERLSQAQTDWLMGDVDHIIFSHLQNDIVNIFDTENE